MRAIRCQHCNGQCYAEHDDNGLVDLKCLQCGRVKTPLNEPIAQGVGMSRAVWFAITEKDWSCFVWDDGSPVLVWDDIAAAMAVEEAA